MQRLPVRRILALLSITMMVLPGCSCLPSFYIPIFPEMVYQDEVRITALGYTPSSPIRVGDQLTFYVTMEKKAEGYYPLLRILIGSADRPVNGLEQQQQILQPLNDGDNGDAVAHDQVWTARYTWPEYFPPQADIPVAAVNSLGRIEGIPLTVLSREEE